jgi:eukaryotic-like serine/threonine-protein kinase
VALTPGTRLGVYDITAQIGAGGMGEVYRATDTNLKRSVAIKVLPASVAGDADRLARFQREAEVLAALNHPNIAAIYGLEKTPNVTALVMELVEGEDLSQRIARGAIPLDEVLPIAKQIGDALEAAHEQGIIHRDLKPANIKVRSDGTVKVLDFGLAKAMEPAAGSSPSISMSPTITTPAMMTGVGMILGTAAYLSPEQAKGRVADKRSDVWAFGCVLYEMLTGQRAFAGDDVGEVLAEVIKVNVDWRRLEAIRNAALVTLVRRCLRKEPRQRPGDGGAIRLEIDEAIASPVMMLSEARRHSNIPVTWAIAGAIVAMVAAAAATLFLRAPVPARPAMPTAHVVLPLPSGTTLRDGPAAVISPDGSQIAYVASRGGVSQLYIRSLGDFEPRPLTGTQNAAGPFFSPDGRWVGFIAGGRLKKVSVNGGVVADLAPARASPGAWGPDDTIIFFGADGLAVIPASGGSARTLLSAAQVDAGGTASFPGILPVKDKALVSSRRSLTDRGDDASIDLLTVSTGERRILVQGGILPRYLRSGHLVFMRAGSLMAVPFDVKTLETQGAPVEVLKGIRTNYGDIGTFSCSDTGSCIYAPGITNMQRNVVMVDRTGTARSVPLPAANYSQPRLSPGGDRLLYWIEQARCDVAVVDLVRGGVTRLTSDGDNHYPAWVPGAQQISYISRKPGTRKYSFFLRSASGGSAEEPLAADLPTLGPEAPMSWAPDRTLAYSDGEDIWTIAPNGDRRPRVFANSRFVETTPAFSPDGQWIAYASDESGQIEVYLRPFPGPGEKYPISTSGGGQPAWSRSGKELFYRNGDQMMAVDVQTQPFRAARPKVLFTGRYLQKEQQTQYDVAPNGDFVMLSVAEGDQAAIQINLLMNWFEELKAHVPTR